MMPAPDHGVTVLVVDDHRFFRDALRHLIAAARGFVLVGEACSGEALLAVESLSPHLVLMDVGLPGIGGIAAAREIVRRHPGLLMVLISIDDPALVPGAGRLGRAVACARGQDLTPVRLTELWATHRRWNSDAASPGLGDADRYACF